MPMAKMLPMSKQLHVVTAKAEVTHDTTTTLTVDLSELVSQKLGRNVLQGSIFRLKYVKLLCTNDDGNDAAGFQPLQAGEAGYGFYQSVMPTKYNINAWQQMKNTWLEQQRELVPLPGGFREFAIGYYDSNPERYFSADSTPTNPVLKDTLRALKVVESAAAPVTYNDHSLFYTGVTNDGNDSTAILDNYDEEHQILTARVKDQDGVTIFSNKYDQLASGSEQRVHFNYDGTGPVAQSITSSSQPLLQILYWEVPSGTTIDQVTGLCRVKFRTFNDEGTTHPSDVSLEIGIEGWKLIK